MSLWAKAQALPRESFQQISTIYGDHFPIEVRHLLAQWIEEKMWANIDPELPQHEQYVAGFVSGLIQELQTKAACMDSLDMSITKMKLIDTVNMFKQRYANAPLPLFQLIRQCLNTELKLVEQVESCSMGNGSIPSSCKPDANTEIAREIKVLRQLTYRYQTGEALRKMGQNQEAFAIHYHECTKNNAQLMSLEAQPQTAQSLEFIKRLREVKTQHEQRLNQMVAGLVQMRLTLAQKLQITVNHIASLQARVLDEELIRWKREQQLSGNGFQFNSALDNIQEWCENLAEIIWSTRQQIKELERLNQMLGLDQPNVLNSLPELNTQITQLLRSLVTSFFIIEQQPVQLIKKDSKFAATVRLLVGGKLNIQMTPPQVKVTIISEAQAKQLLKNDQISKGDTSGEIINSSATMEFHQATRVLAVTFRNMQLKAIKRSEKKGTEKVLDEKFSLLFQSQFTVGGGELLFHVWTLSLPVVVKVHGSQDPDAWATITWDNTFAKPGRVPFEVPEKVPWKAVADALSMKFRSATGRALTEENLKFLAEKAFKNTNMSDYSSMLLSWSQFCKEPLTERSFTFWEWFYAVMKLTKEYLRGLWSDGRIVGFIQKKQVEEMLSSCGKGTFLLRFSDSELGGVTIAWVGETEVYMLQPFVSKDFGIRSISDRIADLQELTYLYPNIPKHEAFGKYYSPPDCNSSSTRKGYVPTNLVTRVGRVSGLGSSPGHNSGFSYPNTSQSSYLASSPDPSWSRDTLSVNSQFIETSSSSFPGTDGPVSDMDLSLTDDEFPFDLNMWPLNQTFAGVKINFNNNGL